MTLLGQLLLQDLDVIQMLSFHFSHGLLDLLLHLSLQGFLKIIIFLTDVGPNHLFLTFTFLMPRVLQEFGIRPDLGIHQFSEVFDLLVVPLSEGLFVISHLIVTLGLSNLFELCNLALMLFLKQILNLQDLALHGDLQLILQGLLLTFALFSKGILKGGKLGLAAAFAGLRLLFDQT